MLKKFQIFLRDEEGATAVEYGLIVGLIAAVIVTVVGLIGGDLFSAFTFVENQLSGIGG